MTISEDVQKQLKQELDKQCSERKKQQSERSKQYRYKLYQKLKEEFEPNEGVEGNEEE